MTKPTKESPLHVVQCYPLHTPSTRVHGLQEIDHVNICEYSVCLLGIRWSKQNNGCHFVKTPGVSRLADSNQTVSIHKMQVRPDCV